MKALSFDKAIQISAICDAMLGLRISLSSSPFFFFFFGFTSEWTRTSKIQKLRAFAKSKRNKTDHSFLLFLPIHIYPYLSLLSVSPVCSYLFHSHLHHYDYHGYFGPLRWIIACSIWPHPYSRYKDHHLVIPVQQEPIINWFWRNMVNGKQCGFNCTNWLSSLSHAGQSCGW